MRGESGKPPRSKGIAWQHDHGLGMDYCRQLAYLFDLDDGSHVRLEMDGHLYVARVGHDGLPMCDPRMFVANHDTCDHVEARVKAFLDTREAHRVAWRLFWDLAVVPAFEGKDGTWLSDTFGEHAGRWFGQESKRRAGAVSSVLES